MRIHQYSSARDFLDENEEVLLQNESLNNLMLGLAVRLSKDSGRTQSSRFYSLEDNGKVIAQAIRNMNLNH